MTEERAKATAPRVYDPAAVADRLRQLVELMKIQADWKQADFARKARISASRLSHYLAGTHFMQLDTAANISLNVGVSLDWLVFGTGPMWEKDKHDQGEGVRERVLALSHVLQNVVDELRRTVVLREGEERGESIPGLEALVQRMIEERGDGDKGRGKRRSA